YGSERTCSYNGEHAFPHHPNSKEPHANLGHSCADLYIDFFALILWRGGCGACGVLAPKRRRERGRGSKSPPPPPPREPGGNGGGRCPAPPPGGPPPKKGKGGRG